MTAPQKYKPTRFMSRTSHYDESKADFADVICLPRYVANAILRYKRGNSTPA